MVIYHTLLGNHTYPLSIGKDSLALDYAIPTGIHMKEVLATTNWIEQCQGQRSRMSAVYELGATGMHGNKQMVQPHVDKLLTQRLLCLVDL